MYLESFRLPIAVFAINFGSNAPSRTEQFLKYKNISLSIIEENKFQYTYEIHCNELFYETTEDDVLRENVGVEENVDPVYEFSMTHSMSRGPHKLFSNARVACGGQWVLLVRTCTMLFLLMDARGNVLRQVERALTDISGMDWIDPH